MASESVGEQRPLARPARSSCAGVAWRLLTATVGTCSPLPGHRAGRRGRVLRDPVAAAADLRAGGEHQLHRRARSTRTQIENFRESVIDLSSKVLTEESVNKIVVRTLDQVLQGPRFDIISIGFVLVALVGLARAQRLRRHDHDHVRARRPARHRPHPDAVVHAVRRRAHRRRRRAAARAGRAASWSTSSCRPRFDFVNGLYWPIVIVLSIAFLTTLVPPVGAGAHARGATTCRARSSRSRCGCSAATCCGWILDVAPPRRSTARWRRRSPC